MARARRTTRAGRALVALLAVVALAPGCGKTGKDERAEFCGDAEDLQPVVDPYRNISSAGSPDELETLFETQLANFRSLEPDAPDDIRDDFQILIEGLEAYQGALADAGWDAAAADQAEVAELTEQYRPASDAVNQWLKRCDIDTGAGAATTTSTG